MCPAAERRSRAFGSCDAGISVAKPLERATTIALGEADLVLEGLYLGGRDDDDRGAVIAPPHPLYGGSMDSPVVNELAFACHAAGLASLRFNWRGVGGSAGSPTGDAAAADADYQAAALHLEETVAGPLVAAGYSFGAGAALRVAARRPRLQRLLLVSPPVALLDTALLAGAARDVLVVTGERDEYAPPLALEKLCLEIPAATLRVVAEADHFFVRGLADIARAVGDWL
jgi:alpha/beta superfamily hydrolase